MTITELCNEFGIEPIAIKTIDKGIINTSFLVMDKNKKRYIFQEISPIFNVEGVMHNIEKVTEHIKEKAKSQPNADIERCTLNLIHTQNGDNHIKVFDDKNKPHFYRMFDYIENASTYDTADEALLYEAGVGFGKFQKDLADFPAESLQEIIKDFHNTPKRFENFKSLVEKMNIERRYAELNEAFPEIQTAMKYGQKYANVIMGPLNNGEIPLRVVHNDTKLNNIMIDNDTHKAVCAIDLDTVMPGAGPNDYGDAIRFCSNAGAEDDRNLTNVTQDMNKFKAFTEGYMSQVAESITPAELKIMPKAPIVIAFELGLRFLTDYLEGNKYFKCDSSRPRHNLERTRAQFKLMQEMERNLNMMTSIINHSYHNALNNVNY